MSNDSSSRPLTQILIAVVIALLVGGSSPWWWKQFFRHSEKPSTGNSDSAKPPDPKFSDVSTPSSDFPQGSKSVYSAIFLQWPTQKNESGSFGPDEGEYIISPSSNTWIGPGMQITPINGDFVLDLHFRVQEKNPDASLQFQLSGSGQQADYIALFLDFWGTGKSDYSLDKGWIKDDHYLTRDKQITDREPMPAGIATSDWSKENKVTFKRTNGTMDLFVNDIYVRSFPVSLFTIDHIFMAAAFSSKIVLTSLEGRVPPPK